MFMFKRKEIKKEYYLKVGTMFVSSDPWITHYSQPSLEIITRNITSVSFSTNELEAWKSTYSDIKELMDLLGGEIYRVTTEAERVL